MAQIHDDLIRRLASFKSRDVPVVSLYLDLDGRRWPRYAECEARAERLIRDAIDHIGSNSHAGALDDLQKVRRAVKSKFDRSRTRGLAIFACGSKLWDVLELPIPVKDQLVVDETPHVRQLETVVASNRAFGVLLADRQRARFFRFEQGELIDSTERFDELPRHDDDAGDRDRKHDKRHVEAAASQHLRIAASVAFEAWKDEPFDHLVIGAPDDIATQLERELHSYLRDRIAARLPIAPGASEAEIRAAALAVEEVIEREKEAAAVAKVRSAAASGRGGALGLEDVLSALAERRAESLVLSEGYEAPGFRCGSCGALAAKGPTCSVCATRMDKVADVVALAVADALLQGCHVEMCVDNADLDVAGRIGALLRF